jgi:hypothetical protein
MAKEDSDILMLSRQRVATRIYKGYKNKLPIMLVHSKRIANSVLVNLGTRINGCWIVKCASLKPGWENWNCVLRTLVTQKF